MEPGWKLYDICKRAGGYLHGEGGIMISDLAFDSRIMVPGPGTLFVALEGDRHDGHQFIGDLYRQGTRAFLVSRLPDPAACPGAGFCLVKDTLAALQNLAAERRRSFKGRVAAITGSNGKTIVKEWIYQMLSGRFQVHRSPKSYNSQLGVPLAVMMIRDRDELAVIEAGISKPGEMERLQRIIDPEIGLFTNIGTAHQENFSDIGEKLQEKLKLFSGCRKVIFRTGDGDRYVMVGKALAGMDCEKVTWSLGGEANYVYEVMESGGGRTRVAARTPAGPAELDLPFSDEASLENALHAFTFSLEVGQGLDEAVQKAGMLEPVSMRMEILRGIYGSILINDAYNSDIGGLSAALDLLDQQKQHGKKVLILSDLLQSGKEKPVLYAEIAALARQKGITRFIGIGPDMFRYRHLFPEGSHFFHETGEFLEQMDRSLFRDSSVLIKGSRKFGFERIAGELQLKTHQTLLEIDLNAMLNNLNHYRSLLKEDVKIMVMVKALSYGSGNAEIANMLQYHKADYLAVAFIDEGIELRRAGIRLPVMVMNPDPAAFGQMLDFHLEPELYSFSVLEALHRILRYREIRDYPVHVKLDTGMHRLGFVEEELDDLIPLLKRKEFRVVSVFSHLAASDESRHDDFTRQQIGAFERASDRITANLEEPFLRHLLNSAGIERFPEAQYQMVRLGIGLHGIGQGKSLVPTSTYRTTVSQVRKVRKGESIGYSRSGRADRNLVVATIPVGYADGMDRRLGNGRGRVWIHGKAVPVIGNICMDMTMIDVTGLDVREGDGVELFGKQITVSEVAALAGTIPYEILTSIPERVKRVYLQE